MPLVVIIKLIKPMEIWNIPNCDNSQIKNIYLNKLPESAGIVIMGSLCISESFQNRSRAENSLFHAASVRSLLTEGRQMMQQEVGALRLAGTALPGDHNTLVRPFFQHAMVSGISHGEDVRRKTRAYSFILIQLHVFRVVDGVEFEGVDGYQDGADVSVDIAC